MIIPGISILYERVIKIMHRIPFSGYPKIFGIIRTPQPLLNKGGEL